MGDYELDYLATRSKRTILQVLLASNVIAHLAGFNHLSVLLAPDDEVKETPIQSIYGVEKRIIRDSSLLYILINPALLFADEIVALVGDDELDDQPAGPEWAVGWTFIASDCKPGLQGKNSEKLDEECGGTGI